MYLAIKAGLAIKAKPTELNKNYGIYSQDSRGYVCLADDAGISIYFETGVGYRWIEMIVTPEVFANNFEEDRTRSDNPTYNKKFHFHKQYPDDFA